MNARELLAEAARLIERHGWIQRKYGKPETGFCMLGAVEEVWWSTGSENRTASLEELDRAYGLLKLRVPAGPVIFNDAPGRTKEEVLAVLREAARPPATDNTGGET